VFSGIYRVPLARPYWSGATYRAIVSSFLSGRVIHGPDVDHLESIVKSYLDVRDAILCGSGSLALEIALRACQVGASDEVVIPSFCCTSVVLPITAVGARPVLADVGEELNLTVQTVDAALTCKTKAVIVPHLFGNPADITGILELVCGRGIYVIDDAAQALGAKIGERFLGSFGDAGIVSFGQEKVCSGLGGGIAVSRQITFGNPEKCRLLPAEFASTAHRLMASLMRRCWRRWSLPVHSLLTNGTPDPDELPPPYLRELMPNLNAAVAVTLMKTLGANVAARRARAAYYRELLERMPGVELVAHRIGSACLAQIVRIRSRRRGQERSAALIKALRDSGHEVQGSYIPIHLLSPYQQYHCGPLHYVESVWSDLIELPCEPDVRFDDVTRISAVIKRVV
jgi:dTDP-4-amino-4,6-dideoxygalactose transaminase